MDWELPLLLLIGFCAQLVDGALGMAFGLISTTALVTLGFPPAPASAIAHTAEIFTTGASASWHIYYRNVDWRLVLRIGVAGVAGAAVGAWLVSSVNPLLMRPIVSCYLLVMGVCILLRAVGIVPAWGLKDRWHAAVGLVAGFLDASGGGGWGPVATSTLVGGGHAPRQAIGSVNTAEFFVTAAAATTFFFELGASRWEEIAPLALGGLFAAPLGGWAANRIPARMLMIAVGVLVSALALIQLMQMSKLGLG
jgi:uncharacterized membrane protein YfcA